MNPETDNTTETAVADPNDFMASINRAMSEKDNQIARLTEENLRLITKTSQARSELEKFTTNLRDVLISLVEDGEDKDMLRGIAEGVGIEVVQEVTKRITIEASVELSIDIFEEVDPYDFDFTITYGGEEVHIRDSDTEMSD